MDFEKFPNNFAYLNNAERMEGFASFVREQGFCVAGFVPVEENPLAPILNHWHHYKVTLEYQGRQVDFFHSVQHPVEDFCITDMMFMLGSDGVAIAERDGTYFFFCGEMRDEEERAVYEAILGADKKVRELLGNQVYSELVNKTKEVYQQDYEAAQFFVKNGRML